MSPGAHLLGWLVIAAVVGGAAFGASGLRRRWRPSLTGATAALVDAVLALSAVVLAAEVLGLVGAFGRVGLSIAGIMFAVAGLVLRRGVAPADDPVPPSRPPARPRFLAVGVLAAAGGVAGAWVAQASWSLRHGVVDFDSLDYHLPQALVWYQTGRIGPLYSVSPESPVSTYPADAELLHAIGMAAFDRDVLTPVLNLGWLALVLLAVWVAGRSRYRGPLAVAALLPLLTLPVVLQSQPGTALTDSASLATLLAAVALLLSDDRDPVLAGVAGLAAGLSVGTKLTTAVPVLVLSLVLLLRHRRAALAWGIGVVATAGFWYLRNILLLGNPLPAVRLPGLPAQDLALVTERGQTVLSYLDDPSSWTRLLAPQLRIAYGPAWVVVLLLAGAGALLALARARSAAVSRLRSPGLPVGVLGFTGLVALVGYAATPSSAGGANAALFATDLRYALPGLALCLLALALAVPDRWPVQAGLGAVFVAVAIVGLVAPWRREWFQPARQEPLAALVGALVVGAVAAAVVVGAPAGLRTSASRLPRPALVGGIVVAGSAVLAGALPLERYYLTHRYAGDGTFEGIPREIFGAFRDVSGATVAVGGVSQNYPYAGTDLSNRVVHAGTTGRHRELREASDCVAWRTALRRSGASWVVIAANLFQGSPPPAVAWTRGDPSAQVVLDRGRAVVFRLTGPPDPSGCGLS